MFIRRPSPRPGVESVAIASFIETAAPEEPFVGRILFYVGGFSLLSGIGMMFVLHQLVV
jgi:hypothetical protein